MRGDERLAFVWFTSFMIWMNHGSSGAWVAGRGILTSENQVIGTAVLMIPWALGSRAHIWVPTFIYI